jgi:hypothetical protein
MKGITMKVETWQTARLVYWIDAEISAPSGTIYLSFSLGDETAPWGNTTRLSFQSRSSGTATVWMEIHPDPTVCATIRKFAGDKYRSPADAQRLIGMIAADAAPRGELSPSQREAWDGFVEALEHGYAVEIGGAA